jgi:AraC family transcriptional regulator of adaptative response / DNA-3-methyladenine glycosylase II
VGARPGLRIPGVWDPFEAAVRAILGQQVSVAAGRTLVGRVVARAGAPIATGPTGLTHLFPSAAALASADLGGLGLTGGRVAALNALARAVVDRTVDFDRPVAEVVDAIASLPGCGPWTAQYVALRGLGDPDAFPASDLVLRRAAGADGPSWSASALAARADAWRPWRGYAALHLWRAVS